MRLALCAYRPPPNSNLPLCMLCQMVEHNSAKNWYAFDSVTADCFNNVVAIKKRKREKKKQWLKKLMVRPKHRWAVWISVFQSFVPRWGGRRPKWTGHTHLKHMNMCIKPALVGKVLLVALVVSAITRVTHPHSHTNAHEGYLQH